MFTSKCETCGAFFKSNNRRTLELLVAEHEETPGEDHVMSPIVENKAPEIDFKGD